MFHDRSDAGRRLARQLAHLQTADVVVVGVARGGVIVAAEVAASLRAPLDVVLVHKLGVPFQPDLAMGAVGENSVRVLNHGVIDRAEIGDAELSEVESRARRDLARRADLYRAGRDPLPLAGRVVVVVDDGIATGSSARAACEVVRSKGADHVVLAVPVAPLDWKHRLVGVADELINVSTPRHCDCVGQFYVDFGQITDDMVIAAIDRNRQMRAADSATASALGETLRPRDDDIDLRIGSARIGGHLTVPEDARGIVVFANASGNARHSPRHRVVASALHRAGLATLLFDLLTPEEEQIRSNVFDIDLLATRLREVTHRLTTQHDLARLPVAYFGVDPGAAAALSAAATSDVNVSAVVVRNGKIDLAGAYLGDVRAPTLLLVDQDDPATAASSRQAVIRLHCEHELVVIPGAGHHGAEAAGSQAAADLTANWILDHLATSSEPLVHH